MSFTVTFKQFNASLLKKNYSFHYWVLNIQTLGSKSKYIVYSVWYMNVYSLLMSWWFPPSRWGRCWCWRTLSHCPGWWWTLPLSLQLKAHLYLWHPTLQQFPQPYFLVLYLHTAKTHTNTPFQSYSTSDVSGKFSLNPKMNLPFFGWT